ncbi:ABC transporter permease [Phytoactinopolyspora sp. XMNu-373]|uniref:Transport permease protein n=2 Tax=Phytoactinopolyspora mesophila TaxID=2650750 RepID=A0A7K3M8F7_9ACTN|nr:ABC transporter permease [Phytoactinopolyspora mesophila]
MPTHPGATPQKHATPSQALTQCTTLSWRGIVKIPRHPMGLADVIIGPAIFLVLFGYVFGGAIAGDTDGYLQYVFPGILGMMTLFATMGVGVALSSDLSTGIFDRFRSLPIVRIAPLIGAIGSDIVRQIISLTALVGFGLLLGVRFNASIWSVLAGCALALAFALALSWVWVLLALAVKDTQAVQGLGAIIILPLAFASNIFVQPETMPDWMQTIATWNPVGHLVDAVRGLMMGGPVAQPVMYTVIWMAAFVVIFTPLSLIAYKRRA